MLGNCKYMSKVKSVIKWSIILVCSLLLLLAISIFISENCLSVTYYEYNNKKIREPFTVVQISDLHNHEFGKSNRRLIDKIAKEQPDVIFMTGDMLNDDECRTDLIENLVKALKDVAPVYFSLGNHEKQYMKQDARLISKLEDAGAVVLDKDYLDTNINGQEIRIAGVYGYVLDWESGDGTEQRFMEEFEGTDRFKILLSHIPEGLLLWKSMEYWDVDLIFSGHVHGGQIRLPFIGGLYDPEEGYLPTYTKGKFACGNSTMILSAGLGTSGNIPRVNNLPEIVVCQIQ